MLPFTATLPFLGGFGNFEDCGEALVPSVTLPPAGVRAVRVDHLPSW